MLLLMLAACAIGGADALNLLAAHERALDDAQAETANLSRSLADQAHGVFLTMDTILVGVRERVETDGVGIAALARLQSVLRLRYEALPTLHRLMITDSDGRVLAGSGVGPGFPSVRSRLSFSYHRSHPDRDVLLGWPVHDLVDGSWVITVSRRWNHADGSFGGVVTASVSTAFFRSFYAGFDTGRRGIILLVRADGINIARWPADPRGEAFDVSGSDLFRHIVGPGDREGFQNYSQADHLVRLASYHRVPDVPALVMVGTSRQDVLAGWWLTVGIHVVGLVVVIGTLVLLTRRLARNLAEEERTQAVLRRANHRLCASEAAAVRANGWLQLSEQVAQVGHWTLDLPDAPGKPPVVTWSDEVFRIYGQDPALFTPTLAAALGAYHPDDIARVEQAVALAQGSGLPFEFTARIIQPDGVIRHVLSRGLPQMDARGAVRALFGVLMDTSEQNRAELALREAHARGEAANRALEAANRALERMAMQDSLTELANRRQFDSALQGEFRRAARIGARLALIMIDVDCFKAYNDLYGHLAGDACLRSIAATIPLLLKRPGDTAARYGGEELAVLLPGSTEAGALALAQSITQAVRALAIPHAGSPHGVVTISAGVRALVAVYDPMQPIRLVEEADSALYAAKRAGRNRALAFQDTALAEAEARAGAGAEALAGNG